MADPLEIYRNKKGLTRAQAIAELEAINEGFKSLYETGTFDLGDDGERAAHDSMAASFKKDPDLLRAFDTWRTSNGFDGVQDTLRSANNTMFAADAVRGAYDTVTGGSEQDTYEKNLLEPYGYIKEATGTYSPPYQKEQAREEAQKVFEDNAPPTDEEAKAEQSDLNLDDPAPAEQIGNPYLFGTEGNQSQIANLSDIGNGKVAMPNRSDRRSMADFNESVMSKEFALNAAKRKARELESLEKARRNKVSLTEPAMERWIKANPKSRAAKLALDADGNVDLSKISDAEKIQFTKNLNLGNIDFFNKPEGPKGVPIFDKDGLVGFENTKKFEEEMGGESIKVAKVDPRTEAQKREDRILDDIDQEIKETGQHPFGEDPVLGTNYRQEVRNREKYGPGYKQLKDQSIDLFNNPEVQKSIPSAPSIPMAPTAKPSMPASYNRSIVSPEMLAKNSQDVSDVLDSVPMPAMPKRSLGPIKSSPYNYTHRRTLEYPTEPSQSGLVNSTKEYPTFSLETPAEPGPELTRTTKEYPTEPTQQSLVERTLEYPVTTPEGAQQRKQTSGFGRSGKKQFNIPALDFLDLTNYTYNEPSYEQTQLPGFGRSGKKQFNLKFLDRLDPRNYSYKQ